MSQKKIKRRKIVEKLILQEYKGNNIVLHSIKEILKRNWIFLTIISLAIFGVYFNGLKGDFVSDDYATIINNSDIHSLKYFRNNFTPVVISNFIVGNIFGVTPLTYHLFSVFLYIFTCWLAFVFLNFIATEKISKITMVVFAAMPIHVEAVTWISGKPYLFIAIFVLFSLICLFKYLENPKILYAILGSLSFLLGIMSDLPRPFSIFVVLWLYLIFKNEKELWHRAKKLIPYALIVLLIVAVIKVPTAAGRVKQINSGYNQSDSIFYNPFFQYPTGIPKYLQLIFFPVDLTLYHTMYTFPVWLNWAIILTYLAMIVHYFNKNKIVFFALVFFLFTLLPSMAPIKVSWLVAERYAYLPSLGIALFMAVYLDKLWNKNKYIPIIFMGVWCVVFSIRIIQRNIDWQTNHKLWVNTCQVSPNSHNAWNNIGDDYDKLKDYGNAVKGFTQSVLVKPNYADAYHNRANIFFKTSRLDLARESYETALKFSPELYQTYLSLTQIDLYENKFDLAVAHATKATEVQPNDPQTFYVLGIVKAQMGLLDEAKRIFQSILNNYPNYELAKNALLQVSTIMNSKT